MLASDIIANNYDVNESDVSRLQVTQQDNLLFRQIRIITNTDAKFNKYIVYVDSRSMSGHIDAFTKLIVDGFVLNGVHYVIGERSASMTRQSILSFVDESIYPELDKRISMGLSGIKTCLAKYYAYRGLLMSSCHCLEGWRPNIVIVHDLEWMVKDQKIKYLYDEDKTYTDENGVEHTYQQKNVAQKVAEIEVNATDGCGVHSPSVTNDIMQRLNFDANRERPTSIQVRAPWMKGLSHEIDFKSFYAERGVKYIIDVWGVSHLVDDIDCIWTTSMYKGYKYYKNAGDYSDWEEYWRQFEQYDHCLGIAKWNYSRWQEPIYTRANYQILQDLKLPFEQFEEISHYSKYLLGGVLDCDPFYVTSFLGLNSANPKIGSAYAKAIKKDFSVLNDPIVRQYVRQQVSKYVDGMKCGKLWIKGRFKFLAPDLILLLEHAAGLEPNGFLQAGEFYAVERDGYSIGDKCFSRNPHIAASEHVVMKGIDPGEYGKYLSQLDNVLMISGKDITQSQLNGADFDGDLVLLNEEDLFMQGIDRNAPAIIDIDDKITVESEYDTPENKVKVIIRGNKNMIGEYSNYATAYHNKMAQSSESRAKYDSYIDIISVMTGKAIDYAKTGVLFLMPRYISKYGRPLPMFMKYCSPYYAKQKLLINGSNMNNMCRNVEKWAKMHKFQKFAEKFDYSVYLCSEIPKDASKFAEIEAIFHEYCALMRELSETNKMLKNYPKYKDMLGNDVTKSFCKNTEVDFGYYYDLFEKRCRKAVPDQQELANYAVELSYTSKQAVAKKFCWVVAADGILSNMKTANRIYFAQDDDGKYEYLGKYYKKMEMETV